MHKRFWTSIIAALGIFVLILDTKTAITAAQQGIKLCVMTVVPSLFPFFILSILLTTGLSGVTTPILTPFSKLLKIPKGAESIFLIGILGGYPTGAKAIADSYNNFQINKSSARRLLGFCNNAGPAFIFGIAAAAFPDQHLGWSLWIIHILSAILVGVCLPESGCKDVTASKAKATTVIDAFRQSLFLTVQVCGWVILFRVVIAFLNRWFLWMLPVWLQVSVSGLLELTNGCTSLSRVASSGLRFILCSGILSFGGLCVSMQTYSVTGRLGIVSYLGGKSLQMWFSILLSMLYQGIYIRDKINIPAPILGIFIAFTIIFIIFLRNKKKTIAFGRNIVYNVSNIPLRRHKYAVSKEN